MYYLKNKVKNRDSTLHGFTLVELVLVLFVLGIVSTLAAVRYGSVRERAQLCVAANELQTLREGFLGSGSVPGYLADMEGIPGFSPVYLRVHNLLVNTNLLGRGGVLLDRTINRPGYAEFQLFAEWDAVVQRGWHGPYLRSGLVRAGDTKRGRGSFPYPAERSREGGLTFAEKGFFPLLPAECEQVYAYGQGGEPALTDPWGNPYVLQVPLDNAFIQAGEQVRFKYARLVSAGPDGILQTPCYSYGVLTEIEQLNLRLAGMAPDGSTVQRGDDIVLFLNRADIFEAHE